MSDISGEVSAEAGAQVKTATPQEAFCRFVISAMTQDQDSLHHRRVVGAPRDFKDGLDTATQRVETEGGRVAHAIRRIFKKAPDSNTWFPVVEIVEFTGATTKNISSFDPADETIATISGDHLSSRCGSGYDFDHIVDTANHVLAGNNLDTFAASLTQEAQPTDAQE